jgi:hypothetical protein
MIFDFYLQLNGDLGEPSSPKNLFLEDEHYKGIKGSGKEVKLDRGFACSLNRRNYQDFYLEHSGRHIWVFGYVYTNKAYQLETGSKPEWINVAALKTLMDNYPEQWYSFIKGMFNIVSYTEGGNIDVYSDTLNMLPLYVAQGQSGNIAISSNTHLLLQNEWVDKTPDELALGMQQLFDYTLGEYYYVKGIRRLENARHYEFGKDQRKVEVLWDVSELKTDALLPRKESLDQLGKMLHENVNLYAAYAEKVLVSLTGGFDGRTNLAVLQKQKENFKCYSYGMPGSKQIRVPSNIADTLNFDYQPVYLEEEYEKKYEALNDQASYFSNGTAPVGFGNISYCFSQLSAFSDTVITGLLGSEVLRPLHNNQIQVNDQSFAIFLNEDFEQGVAEAVENRKDYYFTEIDKNQLKKDLVAYFKEHYFDKYEGEDKVTRFFYFIIQEGLRKYFSQEISIERVYVNTMIPYFDVDFVKLIYQTTWAGIYNGFLGKSKVKRRKGQLLYAHIMKKYKPALLKLKLDRGYNPGDLLLPTPLNYFKLALGVYQAKKYMKKHQGNDTFDTYQWSKDYIQKLSQIERSHVPINLKKVEYSMFENGHGTIYLTYRHMASLKRFLQK